MTIVNFPSDLLELATATLQRVRDGEVQALAVVEVRRDGIVHVEVCGDDDSYHEMNSGAARLAHLVVSQQDTGVGKRSK